jgi:hypothetical protein
MPCMGHPHLVPLRTRRALLLLLLQIMPTPLTRLRWWRVCLDEAQVGGQASTGSILPASIFEPAFCQPSSGAVLLAASSATLFGRPLGLFGQRVLPAECPCTALFCCLACRVCSCPRATPLGQLLDSLSIPWRVRSLLRRWWKAAQPRRQRWPCNWKLCIAGEQEEGAGIGAHGMRCYSVDVI